MSGIAKLLQRIKDTPEPAGHEKPTGRYPAVSMERGGCHNCGKNLPPPPPRPGLTAMAGNLLRAAGQFISEPGAVDERAYQWRLARCERCNWLDGTRCNHCGCFTGVKARATAWDCPQGNWPTIIPGTRYVTATDLARDTEKMIGMMPKRPDVVVGIARSGLLPATQMAATFHSALYATSPAGLALCGHGARFHYDSAKPSVVAIVDDTTHSGRQMKLAAEKVYRKFPQAELIRCVVYAHPRSLTEVDVASVIYPGWHYLEWNLFNAGHAAFMATDMDGVLCDDFTVAECVDEDGDGQRYLAAMANRHPRQIPCRAPLQAIITSRLERYRSQTEEWLEKWKIKYKNLIMGPWATTQERHGQQGRWKAEQYALLTDANLFVESDPRQANEIVLMSNKPVLCPTWGDVRPCEPEHKTWD
jgi:orotate phosphoribosyltransferase